MQGSAYDTITFGATEIKQAHNPPDKALIRDLPLLLRRACPESIREDRGGCHAQNSPLLTSHKCPPQFPAL